MMRSFSEYLSEQATFNDGSLTIFDIDETLFHTTAQIAVKKGGKVVKSLSNSEFNTYMLTPGESFDFSEFRSADKFAESKPIGRMIEKAKAISKGIAQKPLSRIIILTARADFDNKEKFLDVFRNHGLDMSKIRVERAGNILSDHDVATKKYMIIYNYLNTRQFSKVRLFDDSMENLKVFLKLSARFPTVKFEAYYAKPDGSIKTIKEMFKC
jgi:hypothetical protein